MNRTWLDEQRERVKRRRDGQMARTGGPGRKPTPLHLPPPPSADEWARWLTEARHDTHGGSTGHTQ